MTMLLALKWDYLYLIPILILFFAGVFFYKGKRQDSLFYIFSAILLLAAIGIAYWIYLEQ